MSLLRTLLLIFSIAAASAAHALPLDKPKFLQYEGIKRHYFIDIPQGLPSDAPLVIALHGMGGQAHKMRYGLGLHSLARKHKFAVLYPQGSLLKGGSSFWNAGFDFSRVDDLGFVSEIIEDVTDTYALNKRQVYVMGISNGAQMAYHLACNAPHLIAGVASVIGTISSSDWPTCRLKYQIALLHIHGLQDTKIKFHGGDGWHSGVKNQPSIPKLVNRWAKDVGAKPQAPPTTTIPDAEITLYRTSSGVPVKLITLTKFAHDWPHKKNAGFSAAEEVITFFMSLARP